MTVSKILSLCSLFLVIVSCSKNDNDPNAPGNIEIIVKDGTLWSATDIEGKPAVETEVTLYSSTSNYLSNHPFASAKTDATGKVVFKGLTRGAYFFVAKKDNKFNFFDPFFQWEIERLPLAYRATGIFQNEAQINAAPHLPGTEPGDFILADLNGDGKLDDRDKTNIPIDVLVNPNKTTQLKSFIGYTLNHTAALFKSKEHAQQVLDNLYMQIGDWYQLQVVLDGVLSDDAGCIWMTDLCQFDNFTFTSSNGVIGNIWQAAYSNISQLNRIIQHVPQLNLPSAEANRLIAQAKGLRGFIYLQLASYFGNLPLQEKIVTGEEDMIRVPLEETYRFIKKDLTEAMGMLPPTWTGTDKRRISGNACKLLLARVAIDQNDPFKASQYTDELLQLGTYQLVNASQIFVNDDNTEMIWNIKPGIPQEYEVFFADTVARNFCPALRFSEVLLINSEAKILLGDLNAAKQNLNRLRLRRNLAPLTISTNTEAIELLRNTWQSEQYKEGQRFIKLVKWGIAMNILNSKGFRIHNSLLPIPEAVRIASSYIQQNPGY